MGSPNLSSAIRKSKVVAGKQSGRPIQRSGSNTSCHSNDEDVEISAPGNMVHSKMRRSNSLGATNGFLTRVLKRKPSPRNKKEKAGNCACCDCTQTPLWREGRRGVRLCNACGIRWVKYGIACEQCNYVPRKHEAKNQACPRCPAKFLPPEPVESRRKAKSPAVNKLHQAAMMSPMNSPINTLSGMESPPSPSQLVSPMQNLSASGGMHPDAAHELRRVIQSSPLSRDDNAASGVNHGVSLGVHSGQVSSPLYDQFNGNKVGSPMQGQRSNAELGIGLGVPPLPSMAVPVSTSSMGVPGPMVATPSDSAQTNVTPPPMTVHQRQLFLLQQRQQLQMQQQMGYGGMQAIGRGPVFKSQSDSVVMHMIEEYDDLYSLEHEY